MRIIRINRLPDNALPHWNKFFFHFLLILILYATLTDNLFGQSFEYKLTSNGTDPTEIRSRADLYFARVISRASRDLFGSQLSGTYAFDQQFSAGMDIPYIYTDLSDGRQTMGIGDISIRGKIGLYRQKEDQFLRAVAAGFGLILDTGNADQGTGLGDYAFTLTLDASYSIADEILITPTIESYSTLGSDSSAANEHELHIKFLTVINFEEGIWISIRPELIIDLTGEYQYSLPIRMIAGYMLSTQFGVSAQYTNFLAGDERVNYFANVDLRFLF
jgi:hypothetical protein